MSTAKELIINRINSIPDDLDELEIIERLYMLARLEHSVKRTETEGALSTDEIRTHFINKSKAYASA